MIFARMIKADAAQRIVTARLDETPDNSRMVMDYATSKPEFEAWSQKMQKASGGKSFGNVRLMHQLVAAGKVEEIAYDDAAKSIDFMIKIADDAVWGMIEEGILTGISQGGMYKRRWSDGKYTRYTALPNEISIVDIPCKPEATLTMLKADGAEAVIAFKPGDSLGQLTNDLLAATSRQDYRGILLAQPAGMLKALFDSEEMQKVAAAQEMKKKDYSGDEREAMAKKGEAMPDGSYPIADKDDLEDAVQAYGRAKNKTEVKAHITKRAKALKATDQLPEDWEGSTKKAPMKKAELPGFMRKGLGEVSQLAGLLQGLTWLASCVAGEAAAERDGSPLPARLATWLQEGSEILTAMATEETQEAVSALNTAVSAIPGEMKKTLAGGDMLKSGARHSKADMARVQAIHDTSRDLGADCGGTMEKAEGAEAMIKAAFELAGMRERMVKLEGENADMAKRLAELQKQPAGGGPVLRTVDRNGDTGTRVAADPQAAEALKKIEAMPAGPDKTAALVRFAMEHPEAPRTPAQR